MGISPSPSVISHQSSVIQSSLIAHSYFCPAMYELLFQKLDEKIKLTEEEKQLCKTFFIPKKLRKRQYLLQEGDVCKYVAFAEKGILRSYTIDDRGGEHVIQFAFEGWWISDQFSFLTGEPSIYNIDALEDCELLIISKQSHDELLQKMPKYETYIRLLITDAYIALQRRTCTMISLPLEERYVAFTQMFPTMFQRVPQHMIASYMGLSAETLSRVRSRLSKK